MNMFSIFTYSSATLRGKTPLFLILVFLLNLSCWAEASFQSRVQSQVANRSSIVVRINDEPRTTQEIERDIICAMFSGGLKSTVICAGISGDNFSPTRHSLCFTYSRSEDAYMACMLNQNITREQIVFCGVGLSEAPQNLACLMGKESPYDYDLGELFSELNEVLRAAPKRMPQVPESFDFDPFEEEIWEEDQEQEPGTMV